MSDQYEQYYQFVLPYLKKYDYDSREFSEKYHFDGELGAIYQVDKTIFRVWSPVVKQIDVLYFGKWAKGQAIPEQPLEIWRMQPTEQGIWQVMQERDLHLAMYLYQVTYHSGAKRRCVDPYAKAVTINSGCSVVFNPEAVKSEFQEGNSASAPRSHDHRISPKKAIVYETSIRDITSDPRTTIQHKGKFLGLAETGKVIMHDGITTPVGLDYIKSLGVTHLQLMPFFDFATVDERDPENQYNWGYDPLNYNVPDGSFSIAAENPLSRILELKTMIHAIHEQGLSLIMDVVYNHVFDVRSHPFSVLVPGYYFRHLPLPNARLANATLCGNELASERSMVQKYIVDSVLYWCREFSLDGFRFDLMGILDIDTMQKLRLALDNIDPRIISIGEGWDMGDLLPQAFRASAKNARYLPGYLFFNEQFRNAVRGNVFNIQEKGFIMGNFRGDSFLDYQQLKTQYASPGQMLQYVEVHDNATLFDHLDAALTEEPLSSLERRQNLANSMVILLPGTPFIHSGQEFMRTKFGNHNSYNSPDSVNRIDWAKAGQPSVSYLRDLIAFRKLHEAFLFESFADILERAELHFHSGHLLKYRVRSADEDFWIFFNSYEKSSYTLIDAAEYRVYFADNKSYLDIDNRVVYEEGKNTIEIPGLSTLVMKKI